MPNTIQTSAPAPQPGPDVKRLPASCRRFFFATPLRIHVAPATEIDLPDILQLQADNSNALGFLTRTALAQYIAHAAVWTAQIGINARVATVGYIVSPPPRRYLPSQALQLILQCVVDAEHRRKTIATAMVEKVSEDAQARGSIGIQATVADRLQANAFWRNAGFVLIGRRTTANARKRDLNVYRLPFGRRIPAWIADPRRNHAPR